MDGNLTEQPHTGPHAFSDHPRTCLAKRTGKLDDGLKKFTLADHAELTELQRRNFNSTLKSKIMLVSPIILGSIPSFQTVPNPFVSLILVCTSSKDEPENL